jgi:hypothetical protein
VLLCDVADLFSQSLYVVSGRPVLLPRHLLELCRGAQSNERLVWPDERMYLEARPTYTCWSSVVSTVSRCMVYSILVVTLHQSEIRSQVKRDYPLNLSILLRGGKEHNYDALSNGE